MPGDILLEANKPGRYIGREWNVPDKDFAGSKVRFALAFPDLYEVGMSNLGIRILYGILNGIPGVSCERVFSAGEDFEKVLRANGREIFSLETKSRLRDFDLLGFSLGSELDYTNVLNMLDLGSLPLKAGERDNTYPLVVGGGPCALNPEPMHDFFDIFVIGEAEELLPELVDLYGRHKDEFRKGRMKKEDLLILFSGIEGVYVPSLYNVEYSDSGWIEKFLPLKDGVPAVVRKRIVKDLDKAVFPLEWLVPYIQIIHDRITVEVMRGCPNRCRFCQARSQYFPLRLRSLSNIELLAQELYKRTGYEELSLCGLSVGDYPRVEELLTHLMELFRDKAVSVSLPSLKARLMLGRLSSLIASVKKTGLTFAPEAGSARLRDMLAKDFKEDEFFAALEEAYRSGYRRVKLYFMIGLPYETDSDLDAIIELSVRVSQLRKKATGRGPAEVSVSINTLIPKPHTPLQWFGMEPCASIDRKQRYLKDKAKNSRLEISFHNSKMSFLEGVLSRGDRRLAQVILNAHKKGARFDAWSQSFSYDLWASAFQDAGIDPDAYLSQIDSGKTLAWDFIDTGIDKKYYIAEFSKII